VNEGRILGRTIGTRTEPEALGRYSDCFMDARTGLWFASVDADPAHPFRPRPRRGALPRPEQDTPTLTAQVYAIHQRAARRLMLRHLRPRPTTWLGRMSLAMRDRIETLLA
jgi:hypothetical protein